MLGIKLNLKNGEEKHVCPTDISKGENTHIFLEYHNFG